MDDRELLVEKVMRGGVVTESDVAQHNLKRELVQINAEAARRLEAEKANREAVEARESQIKELLNLDASVEKLYLENADNERRREEVLRPIAEREIEIRTALYQAQRKFNQIFHETNGVAYDFRVNNSLVEELRSRGAMLGSINIPVHELPYSPSAIMLLEAREKEGKS
jgi:hypothetical protein